MSTRCQIGFYESNDSAIKSKGQVFVYKHSDGHPDNTLPLLARFAQNFENVRGLDDTCYAPARCLQFLTNESDGYLIKHNLKNQFIGYGVDTVIHMDIEYFYHVSPSEIRVYEVQGNSPESWKVIKTSPLERNGGDAGVRP